MYVCMYVCMYVAIRVHVFIMHFARARAYHNSVKIVNVIN